MKRLGYLPALDGVRGVAIGSVLVYHLALPGSGGFLGVHIFFVLSGFLITTLLLEERAATGVISLRGFYRRRALRLLPALCVALAGYLALSIAASAFWPIDRASARELHWAERSTCRTSCSHSGTRESQEPTTSGASRPKSSSTRCGHCSSPPCWAVVYAPASFAPSRPFFSSWSSAAAFR